MSWYLPKCRKHASSHADQAQWYTAEQVQSTWDENLYTTRLDKTKAAISVAEAQRIADEIEGKASSHRHVAEERNARDTGLQEVGRSLLGLRTYYVPC